FQTISPLENVTSQDSFWDCFPVGGKYHDSCHPRWSCKDFYGVGVTLRDKFEIVALISASCSKADCQI
ncbi:hypothetical protein ACQ9KE_26830, partial [Klebsiella pneumoniae]